MENQKIGKAKDGLPGTFTKHLDAVYKLWPAILGIVLFAAPQFKLVAGFLGPDISKEVVEHALTFLVAYSFVLLYLKATAQKVQETVEGFISRVDGIEVVFTSFGSKLAQIEESVSHRLRQIEEAFNQIAAKVELFRDSLFSVERLHGDRLGRLEAEARKNQLDCTKCQHTISQLKRELARLKSHDEDRHLLDEE